MANIIITSVISGIHRTKVGSHRDVKLIVENDDAIQHIDQNCMVVRIPPIEDIPAELHRVVSFLIPSRAILKILVKQTS